MKNLNTSEKLNKFYQIVSENVDIIFDKFDSNQLDSCYKSKNRIPKRIRVLLRNKIKLSKSILKSQLQSNLLKMKDRLQEIEKELESSYIKRRRKQEVDAI